MKSETLEFKTELKQLMEIIIHSLYSHKEIFLRELLSNASDAIDKVRFESLTNTALAEGDEDWKIRVIADKEAKTLTISDNGIGMDHEAVIENLGTIARSGTRAFIEQLKNAKAEQRPELIGQFGVGFYASFMVADKVTVVSRMAGTDKAVRWESDGQGSFSVEETQKDSRGTDITLHLKDDAEEFLDEWRIRTIVRKFSDFIEHPIMLVKTEEKDGTTETTEDRANSGQAIWLRPRSEIKDEEHAEFYKHISHDFEEPLKTIHFAAEGTMEFKALMYIPKKRPPYFFSEEQKHGLQLYVKRVFITDNCEKLLPPYLGFVKGVVDSSDLSLNVSREMLQQDKLLDKIRKSLVSKILAALKEMKEKSLDEYKTFFAEFGPILKSGIAQDFEHREALAELAIFSSTRTEEDQVVTLDQYVEGMQADQEQIYYLVGESKQALKHSPYLEVFAARNEEVLFFTDPIDEIVANTLGEYKGKKLKAVDKGELPESINKDKKEELQKTYKGLFDFLGSSLEPVKEVRLSTRLKDSASCLVVEEGAMGAHMERIMKEMGNDAMLPPSERILELNGEHPVVKAMQALYDKDSSDARLVDYGWILYDQAVLAEGSKIKDPAAFAKRVNDLLLKASS